jgi:predicted transposase YbfD/YdcC
MTEGARGPSSDPLGVERVAFFSDAVFAIAITLLVIEITVPEGDLTGAQLTHELGRLGPKFFSFGLSFWVIGRFWIGHHLTFQYLRRWDLPMLWINLFWLACIVILPFPTAVLGNHIALPGAARLYAATVTVLAQRQVGGAPEEVPAFAPLVAPLDLAGVVVTADALQTHPDAAEFLVTGKQAHDLLVVKANQPTLLDRCAAMPWHSVPVGDRTRDQAHGRVELRTLKVVSVQGFGFPHAAQVIQVTRKTRDLHTNRWQAVTVYAMTSLPFQLARPARLADLVGGHWAIEALHHVRDTTFAEDDSQVRTGAAPGVMAIVRNLVIGTLCRAGPVNLAAALRRHARDPYRPLAILGISLE